MGTIVEHKCPICKTIYKAEDWKRVCYHCYKNYRYLIDYDKNGHRIESYAYKCEIYLSHPSVTKEEMDAYILKKNFTRGWGVEEWKPEDWSKMKIWVDNTDFD